MDIELRLLLQLQPDRGSIVPHRANASAEHVRGELHRELAGTSSPASQTRKAVRRRPGGAPHALVSGESGHLLVGLMVLVAVILILLTVTGQSWVFIMRRDAEAELIFRG